MKLVYFDVVIVGGGPAGAQCALWLKMMGASPCIVEKRATLGGAQNDNPFIYQSIALIKEPLNGRQISQLIHESVQTKNIPCFLNAQVSSVEWVNGEYHTHFLTSGSTHKVQAKYLVLSTGVCPQSGGFVASDRVLIGPGDHIVNYDFRAKRVAILGGGDNAFENYHFIRDKQAALVHIYARTIRARNEFFKTAATHDIFLGEFQADAELLSIAGTAYDVIVVMYGWKPLLPYLSGFDIARDHKGFLITDPQTAETSIPHVYAIGDVANRMPPCCITAMADGIVAAQAIQRKIDNRSE